MGVLKEKEVTLINQQHLLPLTAHYSANDYNGEKAFDNPLFIKTNRILTFMWGYLQLGFKNGIQQRLLGDNKTVN